tara:strand:- start:4731 stop:5132 length:402 start_codon:yes stop_codon:yes gene_type:complete
MPRTPPDDHPIPDFNRTQLHILQILWQADDALRAQDIEERFDWEIDNATLRSVLRVLMERGEVLRERRGKPFYYQPANKKQKALSTWFSGLAEVFTGGSKAGLIAQLLQDRTLSPEERAELEKIARNEDSSSH